MYSVVFYEYQVIHTEMTGTADVWLGNTQVHGTGTQFLSEIAVGDEIIIRRTNQPDMTRKVTSITSDTLLTVHSHWTGSVQGAIPERVERVENPVAIIPETDIERIDFSPEELESEKPLFRTPRQAVITARRTPWLYNNLISMPKNTVADRNVFKYYVKIFWHGEPIATMVILTDLLSNAEESLLCEIPCYDITKLLEVYGDELANIGADHYEHGLPGSLNVLCQRIIDHTGFNPDLFAIQNLSDPPKDIVTNFLIAELDLNPDLVIGKIDPITSEAKLPDRAVNSLPHGYTTSVLKTAYKIGFRLPNAPMTTNESWIDRNCPGITALSLEIWEAYGINELVVTNPQTDEPEFYYRPMYYVRLGFRRYRFYNITSPRLEKVEYHEAGWQLAEPKHIVDPSVPDGIRRPTYEEIVNIGIDHIGTHHVYGDMFENNPVWSEIKQRWFEINGELVGTEQSGLNNMKFRDVDIPLNATWEPTWGSLYDHLRPCLLRRYGEAILNPQNWDQVFVEQQEGRLIPGSINLSAGQIPYSEVIKSMQLILGSFIYGKPNGGLVIATKTQEYLFDPGTYHNVPDADIKFLEARIVGRQPYSDIELSGIPGDFSLLEKRVKHIFNAFQSRKRAEVELLKIDDVKDIELLEAISFRGMHFGYLTSKLIDYQRNQATVIADLLDRASLKVTVSHGGMPIKDAIVGIVLADYNLSMAAFTNNSGVAYLYNIPVNPETPYDVLAVKGNFLHAQSQVLIADEIQYTWNVNISVHEYEDVEITPVTRGVLPKLVILSAVDNVGTIYYTDDGGEPEPDNPNAKIYTRPFPLYTTKTIRARLWKEALHNYNGKVNSVIVGGQSLVTLSEGNEFPPEILGEYIEIDEQKYLVVDYGSHEEILIDGELEGEGLNYRWDVLVWAKSTTASEETVTSEPEIPEPEIKREYDPDRKELVIVRLINRIPEVDYRYTLDGSEPTMNSFIFRDYINMRRDIPFRDLRVKAFVGEASSNVKTYRVNEDTLFREGQIKATVEHAQEKFIVSPATYGLKITILANIDHREWLDAYYHVKLSAIKHYTGGMANLSGYGTGFNHYLFNSPEDYLHGRLILWKNEDFCADKYIGAGFIPYVDFGVNVIVLPTEEIELTVDVFNYLLISGGLFDPGGAIPLKDPVVRYKIIVEMLRYEYKFVDE